ncbi:hypothetical protein SESBI_06732 [Sesbania bispinosa]|nr:hypothetical protein SESBI_06732 [Sesbania bispinosa]
MTIVAMEINSNVSPRIKIGCSEMMNSLSVNLDEVKIDKKDTMDAEEVNNAIAFVKMNTINHALVLSPGLVRAAAKATVAISVATIIPELAIPLAASSTLLDNFS